MDETHAGRPDDLEDVTDALDLLRRLLRRSVLVLLVIVVAGAVALAFISNLDNASHDLLTLHPALLAAAAGVYALVQVTLMLIWQRLLHAVNGNFAGRAERAAWAVSQLGKYVPTGAMLLVSRVLLAGRAGGSRRAALNSSLYEFGCSFLAALAITAAAVGSMPELKDTAFRWAVYPAPLPLLMALHPRVFVTVANGALRRAGREPLERGLPMSAVLASSAGYAVTFVFAGLGILALATGLTDVPADRTWLVIASFSVGYVASVIGFLLPAGIGVRESGMALTLSTVVPTSAAVSIAVLSRLVQVAVECAMAGACAVGGRRR